MSAVLVLTSGDIRPASARLPVALAVLGLGALIQWLAGGTTVSLFADMLQVSLGSAGLIRARIPYEEIVDLEAVHYSPLLQFGGWGYRFRGKKRAWTARGDEAVVLRMVDGRQIYLGSDRPGRLRERILAIAGTRIGRRRPVEES